MFKQIVLFLSLISMPLLGESLSGEYGITGFNPYTMEPYQGKAIVKERGDIVDVTWHIAPKGPVFVGTGIRKGDTISIAFRNLTNNDQVGVHNYHIEDNVLSGKWILLGQGKKGSETLKRFE